MKINVVHTCIEDVKVTDNYGKEGEDFHHHFGGEER